MVYHHHAIGLADLSLVYFLFPALADRGYSLSRVAGLLIWSYLFWIFTSLGLTQNTVGGILFALCVLIVWSAWVIKNRKSEIINWILAKSPNRLSQLKSYF